MSGYNIAIVGMAGRFPGATSPAEFWTNLVNGVESVREFSPEELRAAGVPDADAANPSYVCRGADIEAVEQFDARFFGLTPQEARVTDPQHRFFLQCSWEALEDAGLVPAQFNGKIAVFASSSMSSYLFHNLQRNREFVTGGIDYPVLLGNDKDFLATRVSYKLNLSGPSMTVQSACSSSLVGIHFACRSLLDGESDAAIAGGVSITVPQTTGYVYKDGGILSRDGRCRVFDATASGTVKGNGCGIVVMKRLSDALADRDQVYAVIQGTAVDNDGNAKAGFTAPSSRGQAAVIRAALAAAGVRVADIGYVETHGTGTVLGDPIELRALSEAHVAAGSPPVGCALGSVKANIGHLDAAAGVVGLIKVALTLRHNTIPPQINFATLNPHIMLDAERYMITTSVLRPAEPLRAAAVSSFGLGGTNAHCVLTAPPAEPAAGSYPAPASGYVLPLSAENHETLRASARRLRDLLVRCPALRLADIAFTLRMGRTVMAVRHAVVAPGVDEAVQALDRFLAGQPPAAELPSSAAAWVVGETSLQTLGDFTTARRVSLPTYPFRTARHWVDPDDGLHVVSSSAGVGRLFAAGLVDELLAVLEKHLYINGITLDDDYYELGGDSLAAVEITNEFRERFGVEVSLATFQSLRTAAEMARFLEAKRTASTAALTVGAVGMVEKLCDGKGAPVFIFPPAGGTNFGYYQLVRHIGNMSPFYALIFPFQKQHLFRTLRELAEHFLAAIRSVQPHGPYRLAGYSFGGSVAFEVALRLQRCGEEIKDLTMFDSHPPDAYIGHAVSERKVLAAFLILLTAVFGAEPVADSVNADSPASLDEALAGLRLPAGSVTTLGEYRKFFDVWKHNHAALRSYYPDRQFDGSLIFFRAAKKEGRELLELLQIKELDKTVWQAHITGALRIETVPGDHYTMFSDQGHVAQLAAAWNQVFAQ
jgi:phthiocerol/phenolphthiocerol synthesis type-I polyketide synthase E